MTQIKTAMTAEEFLKFEARHRDQRFELVNGEVVEIMAPGASHSGVAAQLTAQLVYWIRQSGQGRVLVELGFILRRNPDMVRLPDISLISAGRLPERLGNGYFPGAPDLAVEVVTTNDDAAILDAKIQEYLACGAQRVWVVYPESRSVMVYWPDGAARRFAGGETLTDQDLLPGFALPLAELFA